MGAGSAEQGAELGAEELGLLEAQAHAPQTENRIGLRVAQDFACQFPSPEVEGPHGDGALRERLEQLLVRCGLLVLAGKVRACLKEEELASEQPDPLGTARPCSRDLVHEIDVGQQADVVAVQRTGRKVSE